MAEARRLVVAKTLATVGFLVLLCTTYYLRHEVLLLNEIGFSADEARANHEVEQLREAYPEAVESHQVSLRNHELAKKHYEEMLALYKSDYNAYVKRLKDEYRPPAMPVKPQPPRPPEYRQELVEINAAFRAEKHHYFEVTGKLNWVAMTAALLLVGGLLYLILFDTANGRLMYVLTLVLSFVFLIGPAFHSILSAIVGFLKAPGIGY
jgi:hypothetical protein